LKIIFVILLIMLDEFRIELKAIDDIFNGGRTMRLMGRWWIV